MYFPPALRSENEIQVFALSTQCMFIRKDGKECMFTRTTVRSQNDGKLQEWQKAGVNLEQLQHTHSRLCTLSKSVNLVLSVAVQCTFNHNLFPPCFRILGSQNPVHTDPVF